MDYASLCFLSFERPDFIREAIASAVNAPGFGVEVVVHDDGSSAEVQKMLLDMLHGGQIGRLILSPPGHNEGVGTAFNRCAKLATGDPIIKVDQDLLFTPGWLGKVVEILNADPLVGAAGLFKYMVDPVDHRKMRVGPGEHCDEVTAYSYVMDFVGSAVAFSREIWDQFGPWPEHSTAFAEDVEFKKELQSSGFELALPDEDLATNRGFGIGPSTVVVAEGTVREIHSGPVVFHA